MARRTERGETPDPDAPELPLGAPEAPELPLEAPAAAEAAGDSADGSEPESGPASDPAPQPQAEPAAAPPAKPRRAPAAKPGRKKPAKRRGKARKPDDPWWLRAALLMLLGVCLLRVAVNAAPLIPLHFDEAQYWVYGKHFDFGYFSKPPLAAWLIRLSTDLTGQTAFGVRLFAPVCHLLIGALIYAAGARLYDRRTGFWAAALYTAGPGVVLSSMLMTTDPPMMIGWALALYAYIRAVEPVKIGRRKPQPAPFRPLWWALVGLGIGAGMMAKYTAGVALIGVIGHLRLSAQPRPAGAGAGKGLALAAVTALLALSPNLIWNAMNGFVTVAHLGDNADMGGGAGGPLLRPEKLAEFLGAQFGVIGPAVAAAVLAAMAILSRSARFRQAPGVALLAWFCAPLLLAMSFQALREGANPNWAAPAFVAGCILAAHMLAADRWAWARWVQVGAGALSAVFLILMGVIYGAAGDGLPRKFDPYKKMRGGEAMCEVALAAMETEAADALLMDNRRRLSDCMFLGDLRMPDVAFLDLDGRVDSHYDMVAALKPGDRRAFVYMSLNPGAAEATAARFEQAELVGEGQIATYSDSAFTWVLWRLEGLPQDGAAPVRRAPAAEEDEAALEDDGMPAE